MMYQSTNSFVLTLATVEFHYWRSFYLQIGFCPLSLSTSALGNGRLFACSSPGQQMMIVTRGYTGVIRDRP
jgi:hypothetical protein